MKIRLEIKYLFWSILANQLLKLKNLVNKAWRYCNKKAYYYSPSIRWLFNISRDL
jgi:hypothetical protein